MGFLKRRMYEKSLHPSKRATDLGGKMGLDMRGHLKDDTNLELLNGNDKDCVIGFEYALLSPSSCVAEAAAECYSERTKLHDKFVEILKQYGCEAESAEKVRTWMLENSARIQKTTHPHKDD